MGRARRRRLRRDDEPARRPARPPRRRGPVLEPHARPRGPRPRRHGQGAVPHARRPPGRGGPDALQGRPPLAVPLLAVGLPAHVHVLRDGHDEVRAQPDGGRDPRPGAALPPHRARRPRRVHGHGRADDEPRRRARRLRAPARRRHHEPPHGDLDGRLDPGDRPPRRRRRMPIRLALSLHAADDALRSEIMPVNDRYPARRRPRRVPAVLRAEAPPRVRRVRDARGRQRPLRAGARARATCSTRRSSRST